MADNVAITAGAGTTVSTEEVTTLNGGAVSAQHMQRMVIALRTADSTGVDLPGDSGNGLDVDVTRLPALAAGTNNIGDVDVLTLPALPAGTNLIGAVNVKPATSGGLTTYHLVSAATTNATVVKASAGQLFGWYIYNSNVAARKLAFHNAAATPTAGASIYFTVMIPGGSAANVEFTNGIAFSAGISITTVTGLADADAVAVALNDLNINLWYA